MYGESLRTKPLSHRADAKRIARIREQINARTHTHTHPDRRVCTYARTHSTRTHARTHARTHPERLTVTLTYARTQAPTRARERRQTNRHAQTRPHTRRQTSRHDKDTDTPPTRPRATLAGSGGGVRMLEHRPNLLGGEAHRECAEEDAERGRDHPLRPRRERLQVVHLQCVESAPSRTGRRRARGEPSPARRTRG